MLDWQGGDRLRILTPGGGGYYTPDVGVKESGEVAKPFNQVEICSNINEHHSTTLHTSLSLTPGEHAPIHMGACLVMVWMGYEVKVSVSA